MAQQGVGVGGFWTGAMNSFMGRKPPKVSPYDEAGASGTPIFGGYVENKERDPRLAPVERWRTASDLMSNVSIVAAGLRFFLNLVAVPAWSMEPAEDLGDGKSSDAAKKAADWFENCLNDMATPLPRVIRRSGMYRFHGFAIQEWIAKRNDDGTIGIEDIQSRPQWTIEKWEAADDGTILGVQQRNPQNGALLWIPRSKYLYLVDDMLSDSPEGLGLFRHLVEPGERIKAYLKLEGQGFERDLRGIPVGRAPIEEINNLVAQGKLKKSDADKMLSGMRNFVKQQVKAADTGLLVDSMTYKGTTADGDVVSAIPKWAIELLSSSGASFADMGKAIERLTHDMAMILGVEGILLGGSSGSGNRALGADKSRNLYLAVNAAVADISNGFQSDVRDAIWALNGFPDELKPKIAAEDVAFKDVAIIAKALSDMATAGAVLQPNDPAIDDVRDLMGVSHAPEPDPDILGAIPAVLTPDPAGGTGAAKPTANAGGVQAPAGHLALPAPQPKRLPFKKRMGPL